MSYDSWKSSLDPKVTGSWNLHKSLPQDLDFFVLLSSIAGVAGLRGQSNYAAGNTFLDSLAHYRNAHGQKTISLDLGAMISEGLLAENPALRDRVLASGNLIPITQEMFFALLDHYCNPTLVLPSQSHGQSIIGIEVPANIRAKGFEEESWLHSPLFAHLWQLEGNTKRSVSTTSEQGVDFKQLFCTASTLSEAQSVVTQALIAKLSKSLPTVQDNVDLNKPIHSYGVDSLMAVELRSWFAREFAVDITTFELLGGTSFIGVSHTIAEKSSFRQGSHG